MSWPTSSARTKNWGTEILTDADLEAQLDLLHTYVNDAFNASTGHAHTGATGHGPKISLTAGVQGTLPLANGGTGQTTLAGLLNLVYPIGSTYCNMTDSTNPNTLLGFGTWTAIQDRIIIGIGTTFSSSLGTGGAQTINLAHTHGGVTGDGQAGSGGGAVKVNTATTSIAHSISSDLSATQSVMNPWISGYIWYRTA